MCCSVLQHVLHVLQHVLHVLQCVAIESVMTLRMTYGVLQCVAVCCMGCSVLHGLQCAIVCCSVL